MTETPTIDPAWLEHAAEIARRMNGEGPENFCSWPSIYRTMFGYPREQTWHEIGYLRRNPDQWKTRWLPALVEDKVGNPPLCQFLKDRDGQPFTSGNLIHHCWQVARFEEATGLVIGSVNGPVRVVEFGGGYGSMCRLLRRLGHGGGYQIYDLPELCKLQEWYLKEVGVHDPYCHDAADMSAEVRMWPLPPESLFIATWSLSEVPIEARAPILEVARQCDAFLICYQDKFKELENTAAFALWQATMPEIEWKVMPIGYMPGNTQLMGRRIT
jgi:hypothetical protein